MKNAANIFVVIDPTSEKQPALEKAMKFTEKACSNIHLFMCDYKEPADVEGASSKKDAKFIYSNKSKLVLEGLIEKYKDNENAKMTYEFYWNNGWYDAVGCASTRRGSSIVIKSTFEHSKTHRYLHRTSDFHLIRRASSPIMFVREDFSWKSNRIIAALDLESKDDAHVRMNNVIIRQAQAISSLFDMTLYVVSAVDAKGNFDHLKMDDEEDLYEIIENRYGVEKDRVILRSGDPKDVIVDVTEEIEPDLAVIGTIGRKGLKGFLFGNTVEKVLDELKCDVIAVV